ncbi:MAG: hypothetical protein ACRYF9_17260 [Janthinobacterium lividum]|uniref:hypothetical protein n=1 Tax=Pseudomonas baltica TaxID=2762576 RepID=UPI00289A25B0|nr:hypothetical protein [Pseudomonas baltica]
MEQRLARPIVMSNANVIATPVTAERIDWTIVVLTFLGLAYNAILAFINAHIFAVNVSMVVVFEISVLGAGLLVWWKRGIKTTDRNVLYFVGSFLIISLVIGMLNQRIYLDAFRNILIVGVYIGLGKSANVATIKAAFLACTLLVLGVLILELSDVSSYAALLKPANYYINTRGFKELSYDDSGIFKNALGFEGRFSYGIFTGPRTSSIFLEQVSLANYAAALCILLLSLWPQIGIKVKLLHILTILLVVLSNNTRTTSILLVLSVFGYYLYPRIPRYSNVLLAPIIIALGIFIYTLYPYARGDDFIGRTSFTGYVLTHMGMPEYFGTSIDNLKMLADNGYPYLIYSSTIFGMVLFWLFVSLVVPQITPAQKRCANSLALYMFINLLVSGTATFSIKVGAPLWLLVGFMATAHIQLPGRALKRRV